MVLVHQILQALKKTHGAPLGDDEVEKVKEELNWKSNPFEVPKDILNDWRSSVEEDQKLERNGKIDLIKVQKK